MNANATRGRWLKQMAHKTAQESLVKWALEWNYKYISQLMDTAEAIKLDKRAN